jgi:predicted DNA-binding antitoxin AbrB/MazE fold protein
MSQLRKLKSQKSKRINIGVKKQWEAILRTVTKEEVPVELLESLTVNLKDGSKVNVNVKKLLNEGTRPVEIEKHINEQLETFDDSIVEVDFFICIDSVVKVVQPVTDALLKDL